MNRRHFLTLGAVGTAVALGRSMVTVPGLWKPLTVDRFIPGRIVQVDSPDPLQIGDFIPQADGTLWRISDIVRDAPVGGELAVVEPMIEVRTIQGVRVDGEMMIYRHRFDHDGRFFHIGTSRELPHGEGTRQARKTWHPKFWQRFEVDKAPERGVAAQGFPG